jgi:hypothetical protein
MNRTIYGFWLVGLAVMAGCATRAPLVVRNPVGPERPLPRRPRTDGDLLVYSALRVGTYAQSEYPVHTDYVISTQDDRIIERVANQAGSFDANPARVPLAPGKYHVKALVERGGYVIVPVVVEAGKTTVVALDGEALSQNLAANDDLVRLPDGRVVGWRAAE